MNKNLLMIPGPTEVKDSVLKELSSPIEPHYGKEWSSRYFNIVNKLKNIFQTNNDIIALTASSSAAMDCALSALIAKGDRIILCHNGFFAERIKEIIISWGGDPVLFSGPFDKSIDVEKLKLFIQKNGDVKAIVCVHNETSTGVENPIKKICKIAKEYDLITIIDSVSGLGGSRLEVDKWDIDVAITGSQKCLEGPAGLAIMSVSNKFWSLIKKRKNPISGWYLNLMVIRDYQEKWTDWHPHGPATAAVSLFKALDKSLDNIINEGLEKKISKT